MRVRLGVPAYGGVHPATVRSLILTHHALTLCGNEVEVDMVAGGSVLTKVRNEIVQRFFEAEEDYLVFLDSDMAWQPVDVVRLLSTGKDLAVGNYRIKSDEDKWVCYIANRPDGTPDVVDGLIRTIDAGTGFMAISRDCVQQMRHAYPDLAYTDKEEKEIFALFDFTLRDGKYWGEDYTFCDRWREIGGEIWMLPDCTIEHIGQKAYTGNYHEYLLRCPGGSHEQL